MKNTGAGRKVYGGGGIEPDKVLAGPGWGFSPARFGRQLYARGSFANFADQFVAEGDTRFSDASKSKKRIARGFTVTDEMIQDFRTSLKTQKIKIDEEAFKTDEQFIRAMVRYDIDLALFGVEEARRNLITRDPQGQFGLKQFTAAQGWSEMGR